MCAANVRITPIYILKMLSDSISEDDNKDARWPSDVQLASMNHSYIILKFK